MSSNLQILCGSLLLFGLILSSSLASPAYPTHYEVGYGFVNHGGFGPHGHYLPGSAKVKVHKDPFHSTYAVDEEGPTHYKYVRQSTASDPILHGHLHHGAVGVGVPVAAPGFPVHGHGHVGHHGHHGIVGRAIATPAVVPVPVHGGHHHHHIGHHVGHHHGGGHVGVIGGVGPAAIAAPLPAAPYAGAALAHGHAHGHGHYAGAHLGAAAAVAPFAGYHHHGNHGHHLGGIHGHHGPHHHHHHGGYY